MQLANQKILITGADGFIGSHLTEMLVKQGAHVRALSLYNSFNDWGWLEDTACLDQVEVVCGDVRDPNFCRDITKDIDVVFHLAALIAIPYSYVAPDSYVATNITGTLNMLQAAREAPRRQLLIVQRPVPLVAGELVDVFAEHRVVPAGGRWNVHA